jgi:hypothetical protein
VSLKLLEIHFRILGVTRNSTKEDIKKAYIREIKKWHPDKFQNEPEKALEADAKTKAIIEAYGLLKDYEPNPVKRYRIRSLNVVSIAYNEQLNILAVWYSSGRVIQYPRVPETTFVRILQSEAKGGFINKSMRFTRR